MGDLTAIANEYGLKSPLTLLLWKYQRDEQLQAQEQELLEWILSQRAEAITKQDILNHIMAAYPEFAATKSVGALKIWVVRFLKRHISSTPSKDAAAKAASDSCPDGYVLHSNEFKLNALKKLDEGKSISEVAEELGLKSHNTLAYWNSIRDKLAVADKKRYRLAGGGRRSSCTFEDELLTWVTERHQKGEATDVKAVLDYMREFHPSFTEGKKEPTLRKWILRFFKRCWRSSSVADGSKDMDKSCIFV
ncbi:TPA: hypothetical protein N0F65_004273 [Lagenidium giganteum]|uniref:HTH CENPB-type domain-containing protein n=1 Tax=Lagenidium giganteum TaxID=4803 RepID=A0AAV2ZDV3_9STRA|nr:TPA: hypothetical protein N0F65_004273 [Lagenidium giganteum]